MERLEAKNISGHIYYYYSGWEWVDGRCRRVWQKYLGKPTDIAEAVLGDGPSPACADLFDWGLPTALWNECSRAQFVETVNALCPKRRQGLSFGHYLAIASINRAFAPTSKTGLWDWFSQTTLLRLFPLASKQALSSQRFWDHMDKIKPQQALDIWKAVVGNVIKNEDIDLSSISYDGTNFYTFIDTFNSRCQLAKRGKNKQGRSNLRQVSYALFCSADGQLPLYYELYEGNRNDAKQFPLMLKNFKTFLDEVGSPQDSFDTTIIFDKGNNSANNFALIDSLELPFVGSVKLGSHKSLAQISNSDQRFKTCMVPELEGVKSFRVSRTVHGKSRTLLVTYNPKLYESQWLTLHNDIANAVEKLSAIQQRLNDRVEGLITGGKAPTPTSIDNQCKDALARQHLKSVIKTTVSLGSDDVPRLEYALDEEALAELCDTYLGKNILVTNRAEWNDDRIIKAYRSQFLIEDVFKQCKDRQIGSWWPLNHWTDSKIHVHALYCSAAMLFRALALRRVRSKGINISMKRLLTELSGIREVVNIYPKKRKGKQPSQRSVLSTTSELQDRIIEALGIEKKPEAVLG